MAGYQPSNPNGVNGPRMGRGHGRLRNTLLNLASKQSVPANSLQVDLGGITRLIGKPFGVPPTAQPTTPPATPRSPQPLPAAQPQQAPDYSQFTKPVNVDTTWAAAMRELRTTTQNARTQQEAAALGLLAALSGFADEQSKGRIPTIGSWPNNGSERTTFATQLLKQMGAPVTKANLNSLTAWMQREGTRAAYNPLATTMPERGATNLNSVGVRNYTSLGQGIKATLDTLKNYPSIWAALMHDSGLFSSGLAADFLKWSGGGYSHL